MKMDNVYIYKYETSTCSIVMKQWNKATIGLF